MADKHNHETTREQIAELRLEHPDLDAAIRRLATDVGADKLRPG
jgi:hypothetical protein